jgi:biopolymer transport protein ExbD
MKFPRTVKAFTGRPDIAPFAGVFFLLALFLLLGSLVYTPGVELNLPVTGDLPGTDQPTIAVAVDRDGYFYFDNQRLQPSELKTRLRGVARQATTPPALLVQADKAASYEALVRLTVLARDAGIRQAFLATAPPRL